MPSPAGCHRPACSPNGYKESNGGSPGPAPSWVESLGPAIEFGGSLSVILGPARCCGAAWHLFSASCSSVPSRENTVNVPPRCRGRLGRPLHSVRSLCESSVSS